MPCCVTRAIISTKPDDVKSRNIPQKYHDSARAPISQARWAFSRPSPTTPRRIAADCRRSTPRPCETWRPSAWSARVAIAAQQKLQQMIQTVKIRPTLTTRSLRSERARSAKAVTRSHLLPGSFSCAAQRNHGGWRHWWAGVGCVDRFWRSRSYIPLCHPCVSTPRSLPPACLPLSPPAPAQ